MVAAATIAFMELRFDDRITQIKMGTFKLVDLMGVMISAVVLANKMRMLTPLTGHTASAFTFHLLEWLSIGWPAPVYQARWKAGKILMGFGKICNHSSKILIRLWLKTKPGREHSKHNKQFANYRQ